jgi:hypothetical protein
MRVVTLKICGELVEMIWLDGALLRLDHLLLSIHPSFQCQPMPPMMPLERVARSGSEKSI